MQSNKYFLLILIFAFCFAGCELSYKYLNGLDAYSNRQYSVATEMFKAEFDESKDEFTKSEKAFYLAESYRYSNNKNEAAKWYATAYELGYDDESLFWQGKMLKSSENYTGAIKVFEQLIKDSPAFTRAARKEIDICYQAIQWIENPPHVLVKNLKNLNSSATDYAPVLFDGESLVFSTLRNGVKGEELNGWTGENFSDIFISNQNQAGDYSNAIGFNDNINSLEGEGTIAFSSDFKEAFFTRCSEGDTAYSCQMFRSVRYDDGGWSPAEKVVLFEDEFNVGHPYLSNNGKRLYFSARTDFGYGGKDIYYSNRIDETWSKPKNLGPTINTTEDEVYPYIFEDTLYFSSNGYPGMGGLDIFYATKKGKEWKNVTNLKYPINSGDDDFGLTFYAKKYLTENYTKEDSIINKGYLTSTRTGGNGKDDIYEFVIKTPRPVVIPEIPLVYILKGAISKVKYADNDDPNSKRLGYEPIAKSTVTYAAQGSKERDTIVVIDGSFEGVIDDSTDYFLNATSEGFFKASETFTTNGKSYLAKNDTVSIFVDIILEKIFENREITLDNIYYDLAADNIRLDAALELDKLVKLLNDNPTIKIQLGSHTDSRGGDEYNLELSQRRAQSAVNYLQSKGIAGRRLLAKGFGETALVNQCANDVDCSDAEHQQNRRTTFRVVGQ